MKYNTKNWLKTSKTEKQGNPSSSSSQSIYQYESDIFQNRVYTKEKKAKTLDETEDPKQRTHLFTKVGKAPTFNSTPRFH